MGQCYTPCSLNSTLVLQIELQRHPARREVDRSQTTAPQAAHVESARVVDPKCLKLRTLPVEYSYFMHTQMNKALPIALHKVGQFT